MSTLNLIEETLTTVNETLTLLEEEESVDEILTLEIEEDVISNETITLGEEESVDETIGEENALSNDFVNSVNLESNTLIVGRVQEGKTKVCMDLALRVLFEKKWSVLCILNNFTNDLLSWQGRFIRLMNEYENMGSVDDHVVYVKNTNEKKLTSYINGKPKIYVILGNSYNGQKFNYALDHRLYDRGLYVIVDESDSLMVSSTKKKVCCEILNTLSKSKGSAWITATPNSHLVIQSNELSLKCSDVLEMPRNENHVSYGHPKFIINEIPYDFYSSNKKGIGLQNTNSPEDVELFYIIRNEFILSKRLNRVCIGFINITSFCGVHNRIVNKIKRWCSKATFICVYDSKIKVVYGKEHNLSYSTIRSREKMSLQKNMEFLQTEHNNKNYEHEIVFIIGSKQISRGQSPRSEVDHFSSFKDIWYAQFIIYACTSVKPTDELIQNVFRIGGIFPGYENDEFVGLNVYVTEKISKQLDISMQWFNESMENFKDPENKDEPVIKIVAWTKEKVNLVSTSRGRHTYVTHNDVEGVAVTMESFIEKLENLGINDNSTVSSTNEETPESIPWKILEILKENSDKWMSCREIFNEKSIAWWNRSDNKNTSERQSFNNITHATLDLYKRKKIDRIKNRVFKYKII